MKLYFFTVLIFISMMFVLSPVAANRPPKTHGAGIAITPVKLHHIVDLNNENKKLVATAQKNLLDVIAALPKTTGNTFRGPVGKSINLLPS